MNFHKFRLELKEFPVFSLIDVKKLSEKIYHHRLVEWQKNGYIERVGNGVYKFSEVMLDELKLFYIANKLYMPSYVSLETAFFYYGFIPETVTIITSVSSKKTTTFRTKYATFSYRTIKKSLMFGYKIISSDNLNFKIAESEKAVLDFLYLHSELNSIDHIDELRINADNFEEKIDREKLNNYSILFENKNLNKRLNLLLDWIEDAKS